MDRMIELEMVLRQLGMLDPSELRRAVIAWRARLGREEVKLLDLLARGYTNEKIAEVLHLAQPKSAQERVTRLLGLLGLDDRHHAAAFALSIGLGPHFQIDDSTGHVIVKH